MNKDNIKRYIVQIKGIEFTGSGVLVKSDKNFYIFTAKHNFKSAKEQEVNDIELDDIKEDIENGDIKVLAPYPNIKIKDVIGLNDTSIDFIILVVDNKEKNKIDIEQLKVFNDDFKECVVAGYPKIRGDNSKGYLDCFYETKIDEDEGRDDYRNTFEVYSTKPLYTHKNEEMETIVGISGGGVFVKGSDDNIYLVGIEIEYKGIANLVCISLRDIIDEINEKLKKEFNDKIEVGGFSLYEKFGIDIEKLELKSIKDEISEKNEYIIETLKEKKGVENEYNFLKNSKNEYFKVINKEYKKVGNLAKAFLYNGIVFHENRDYNRATRHFKKAVKLDPNLEVYFGHSKFKREKLSDKQKKAIEKNIANLSSNNEEQLIKNLKESVNNKEELESKILHLNHLLYKKIDLSSFSWSIDNLLVKKTKSDFKQIYLDTRMDIIKYTKKLSEFYLEKKDFQNAKRQLKGLQQNFQLVDNSEINKKLLKIYEESQNDFFGNSCIDRTLLIDELFEFMDRFESNSDEYKKIQEMIKNSSKVDNKYAEFTEKIKKLEKDYDERIGSLSLGLKHISKNIVDKDALMKIDFMLEHLTNSHGSLNVKLDKFEENRIEFKKNYQNILKIFKMIMEKGNKDLEESIKKISHRNSIDTRLMLNQLSRQIERGLGTIEIVQDEADFSKLDEKLKEIVSSEIEKLEIINEKNKIIRLIQKRYGEHVLSLKKSLEDKKLEIKLSDKIDKYSNKIDNYSNNIDKKLNIIIGTIKKTNNKRIDNVLENVCNSNRALVSKIQTMYHQNDRVNKKAKIALKKSIEEINEKLNSFPNENQIEKIIKDSNWNFYQSIKGLCESEQDSYNHKLLEMSIAFTKREHELHIEKLEQDIVNKDSKIKKLEKINPKNQKRLRKFFKKVRASEKTLEEIRVNTSLPIYRLYCLVRNILLGGIILGALVIFELNYKTLISEIEFSKILIIFKDVP